MCLQASSTMGLTRANPRVLQSAEVGPFFSSDGSTLTSEERSVEEKRLRDLRAAEGEHGPVPWCVSADDPRCSPRDSAPHHRTATVEGAHVAAGFASAPEFGDPNATETTSRAAIDGERAGVRHRLERPPRG